MDAFDGRAILPEEDDEPEAATDNAVVDTLIRDRAVAPARTVYSRERADILAFLLEMCNVAKSIMPAVRVKFFQYACFQGTCAGWQWLMCCCFCRTLGSGCDKLMPYFEKVMCGPGCVNTEVLCCLEILGWLLSHRPTPVRNYIVGQASGGGGGGSAHGATGGFGRPAASASSAGTASTPAGQGGEAGGLIQLKPDHGLLMRILWCLLDAKDVGIQSQASEVVRMLVNSETMAVRRRVASSVASFPSRRVWFRVCVLVRVLLRRWLSKNNSSRASTMSTLLGWRSRSWYLPPLTQAARRLCSRRPPCAWRASCSGSASSPTAIARSTSSCGTASFRAFSPESCSTVRSTSFSVRATSQQRMPAWCTLTPTAARCRLSAGIRFFRACVALKDDFYTRHITKYNLFAPVFEVFKRNGMRNNLLNSAIIELVEFVRHHQIVTLIDHIVEGFPELIEQVTYVSTFKALKEAYDRRLGAGASNSLDDRCVHACLPRAWIAGPWWSTVLTAAACDGLCGCDAMLPVRPPPTAVVVPWSMRRTARTGTTTMWL